MEETRVLLSQWRIYSLLSGSASCPPLQLSALSLASHFRPQNKVISVAGVFFFPLPTLISFNFIHANPSVRREEPQPRQIKTALQPARPGKRGGGQFQIRVARKEYTTCAEPYKHRLLSEREETQRFLSVHANSMHVVVNTVSHMRRPKAWGKRRWLSSTSCIDDDADTALRSTFPPKFMPPSPHHW